MSHKIKNISIIASFVSLWIVSFLSKDLELILGFVLILSFGMLHGANDIILFDKLSEVKKKLPYAKMLAMYLAVVFTVLILFYWVPVIALIIFILFSAFHFGEQHWDQEQIELSASIKSTFYLMYGLVIISMLLVLNITQVVEIVESIINGILPVSVLYYFFYISLVGLAFSTTYLILKDKNFQKRIWAELLYLLVIAVIFKVSSLIWGFAIYFIFWHSLPSLYDQIKFMYSGFDNRNMLDYLKKAFPYWLISIVGILGIYFFFKDITIFNGLFFSFLAAVTLPHSFLISRMFNRKV